MVKTKNILRAVVIIALVALSLVLYCKYKLAVIDAATNISRLHSGG